RSRTFEAPAAGTTVDLSEVSEVMLPTPTAKYVQTVNGTPPDATGNVVVVGGGEGGVSDHGALTGLADDDHPQYARTDGSRGAFASPTHTHDSRYVRTVNNAGPDANGNVTVEGGGGGATDHGALTGLGDDDHPQYALADGTRGSFASQSHGHDYVPLTRTVN